MSLENDTKNLKTLLIIAYVVTIESCSLSKKRHNMSKIRDCLNPNDTVKISKKENNNPLPMTDVVDSPKTFQVFILRPSVKILVFYLQNSFT